MTESQGPTGSKLDEIRSRRRRRRVLQVLAVLLLVGAGVGAYLYFQPDMGDLAPFAGEEEEGPAFGREEAPAAPEEEAAPERLAGEGEEAPAEPAEPGPPPLEVELPELEESDPVAREYAQELSPHPEYEDLLAVQGLVRRFTAVVANVAAGKSPRYHLSFLVPRRPFGAVAEGGQLVIDPKSYARYDTVVDVFASLDAEQTVRVYRGFQPLVEQAYRDLGHRRRDFEAALERSITELLAVPVIQGPVPVRLDIMTYVYEDPELESLDPVQKLLLRTGPSNVRKVQAKLREIAAALGIPEDELPPARSYRPRG